MGILDDAGISAITLRYVEGARGMQKVVGTKMQIFRVACLSTTAPVVLSLGVGCVLDAKIISYRASGVWPSTAEMWGYHPPRR